MFRPADPNETYKRTVQIQVPQTDGTLKARSFTAHFRFAPDKELANLNDKEIIKAVLVGWDNIEDHNGSPLEFTPENLETLCEIPYWRRGTAVDYVNFAAGLPAGN